MRTERFRDDAANGRVRNVAVLIDWENFARSCADRGVEVRPARIKERVRALGSLRWSAVFVDTSLLAPRLRGDLFIEGFTICDCPKLATQKAPRSKNLVDSAMIEMMHKTADLLPVDDIVLGSADRDFNHAIQNLRDRGKRVYILTPTRQDNSAIVQHSDGALPYVSADSQDEALADVKSLFDGGVYRSKEKRAQECLDLLEVMVLIMDSRLEINRHQYGFTRLMDEMRAEPEVRARRIGERDLRLRLEFLIDCGVLCREMDDRYARYSLSASHPFVAVIRQPPRMKVAEPRESATSLS